MFGKAFCEPLKLIDDMEKLFFNDDKVRSVKKINPDTKGARVSTNSE